MAIDGDTIIAGTPRDRVDGNENQGSASIFFQPAPRPPAPLPVPAPPPGPGAPPPSPISPGALFPAKLQVKRARIVDGKLDLLVGITGRASGELKVRYRAAGREIALVTSGDAALDRIRFKEPITTGQARLGTGIVTLGYRGAPTRAPRCACARPPSTPTWTWRRSTCSAGACRRGQRDLPRGGDRALEVLLHAAGQPQIYPARVTIQDNGDWHGGRAQGVLPQAVGQGAQWERGR